MKLNARRALIAAIKRNRPVSNVYGLDRGRAIDRFYIERFLAQNQKYIKGRCLELLNNDYTKKFGKDKVAQSDILDTDKKNPHATIYDDLRHLKNVKSGTYDCIILTQVLQFIDDYEAAVRESRRILKKGGVLLGTVPAFSRADVASGVDNDFWRFTQSGAKYLFAKVFGEKNIKVESHGNVLSGLAFWVGLAQEELSETDLSYSDPDFPVLVTIEAIKR